MCHTALQSDQNKHAISNKAPPSDNLHTSKRGAYQKSDYNVTVTQLKSIWVSLQTVKQGK